MLLVVWLSVVNSATDMLLVVWLSVVNLGIGVRCKGKAEHTENHSFVVSMSSTFVLKPVKLSEESADGRK